MPRMSHQRVRRQHLLTDESRANNLGRGARCTIAIDGDRFCDGPVPPDSPVTACGEHLRLAYAYCQAKIDLATDEQVATIRHLVPRLDNQRLMDRVRKARAVVYYALVGNHIKIGTTIHLGERMKALGANLMAVEPGSYDLERDRHQQFASLRVPRTELFRPGPELVSHVAALVQRYTTRT